MALLVALLAGCSGPSQPSAGSLQPCPSRPAFLQRFDADVPSDDVDVRVGSFRRLRHAEPGNPWIAEFRYDGGGELGFARLVQDVSWQDGAEVWYGSSFYFPPGLLRGLDGALDLARWDDHEHQPTLTTQGGVTVWSSDRRLRVTREQVGRHPYKTLLIGPPIPEGRWVRIDVHQRFATENGPALNELYVDGNLVDASTVANMFGGTISTVRFGIVSVATRRQLQPVTVYLDDALISPCYSPIPVPSAPP